MRTAFLLALLLAFVPAAAAAQWDPDTSMARPGTRMRVTSGAERHAGRFWYLRADTVWLVGERSTAAEPVPLTGGERIEITRGRWREAWSGGGALLGIALGVLVSQLNGSDDDQASGEARNTAEAVYAGAGGGLIGGLLGWFVAPQKWHPVTRPVFPPPPPQVADGAAAPPPSQP